METINKLSLLFCLGLIPLAFVEVSASRTYFPEQKVGVLSKPANLYSDIVQEHENALDDSSRRFLKSCRPTNKTTAASFTSLHNKERNALFKKPLSWDDCLAARAQTWATKMAREACALPPKDKLFGYSVTYSPSNLGENIFYTWFYKGKDKWSIPRIMNFWSSQKSGFNFKTKKCYPNEHCSEYLQIIWKPASKFGCGISRCDLKYGDRSQFKIVVCNYDKQFYFDSLPY